MGKNKFLNFFSRKKKMNPNIPFLSLISGPTYREWDEKTRYIHDSADIVPFEDIVSTALLSELNIIDGKFTDMTNDQLGRFKNAVRKQNPYEQIKSTFMDRAGIKLAEIDAIFSLTGINVNDSQNLASRLNRFDMNGRKVTSFFDIAGGPGAWSDYLTWRLPDVKREDAIGFTLKTENSLAWNKIIEGKITVKYGPTGTGDLYSVENLEFLGEAYGGKFDLAVADGGMNEADEDSSTDISQEKQLTKLFLCECIAAVSTMRKGGSFLIKMYEAYEEVTAYIIYLLSQNFQYVNFIKPLSSRPSNSERYLVFTNFINNGIEALLAKLFAMLPPPTGSASGGIASAAVPAGGTVYYLGNMFTKQEYLEVLNYASKLCLMSELTEVFPDSFETRLSYRQGVYNPKEHKSPEGNDLYPFRYSIHLGQAKLCLTEIEAITKAYKKFPKLKYLVYAGAAPGTHLVLIADLFPQLEFHLYDPNDFHLDYSKKLYPNVDKKRFHVYKSLFTDDIAKQWNKDGDIVIFMSDIRTGDMNDPNFEEEVKENMNMQKRWWEIMNPAVAVLKFRLPYAAGSASRKFAYLSGEILLQPFSRNSSTEGRLLVWKGAGIREYDIVEYENFYFWLNTIIREWASYSHGFAYDGICGCFDCAKTVSILRRHLGVSSKETKKDVKVKEILDNLFATTKQSLKYIAHGIEPGKLQSEKRLKLAAKFSSEFSKKRQEKIDYDNSRSNAAPFVAKTPPTSLIVPKGQKYPKKFLTFMRVWNNILLEWKLEHLRHVFHNIDRFSEFTRFLPNGDYVDPEIANAIFCIPLVTKSLSVVSEYMSTDDYDNLSMDKVRDSYYRSKFFGLGYHFGRYSIRDATPKGVAKKLPKYIREHISMDTKVIFEASASIGCDTISLLSQVAFQRVISFEIDPERFLDLEYNIEAYKNFREGKKWARGPKSELKNEDFLPHLRKMAGKVKNMVVYMDPPWGGLDYKTEDIKDLYYGETPLVDIVKEFRSKVLGIVLKLPRNYPVTNFHNIGKNMKDKVILVEEPESDAINFVFILP